MRTMMKIFFIIMTIAMALALTFTIATNKGKEEDQPSVRNYGRTETKTSSDHEDHSSPAAKQQFTSVKRVSRFLDEEELANPPRAPHHCHKDNDECHGKWRNGTTCCNNRCVNLKRNLGNCGSCNNKCNFTHICCNGECVDLSFDKRHCGRCSNRCMTGGYCVFGMCDYA